jgi:hypothetical protein
VAQSRWSSWLAKTHSTQFELVRHCIGQQGMSDLFPSQEQVRRLIIGVWLALASIGPLITYIYRDRGKYAYLHHLPDPIFYQSAVRADYLFFISLSMIVSGLVAVMQWHNLFPDRTDYLVFKPLPVRLSQIFIARFLSVFLMVAAVIVGLNLITSVLFPACSSGRWQSPEFGIRSVCAHAIVTIGGGFFAFFAMVSLQGLLLNLLSAKNFRFISLVVQITFATAFVASIPYVFNLPNFAYGQSLPHWARFLPPAWFLGLHEILLGNYQKEFRDLALMAIKAFAFVVLLGLLGYVASYYRHASRALEQSRKVSQDSVILRGCRKLARWFISDLHELAAVAFTVKTMGRSRQHKLILSLAIGAAWMLVINTTGSVFLNHYRTGCPWQIWQLQSIVAMPLILATAAIFVTCYIFQLPMEWKANWIFRMAESSHRPKLLNSVESVLIFCGLLPALFVSFPLATYVFGWQVALGNTWVLAAVLLLLVEFKLSGWNKVAFTCSYVPGRQNIWALVGKYLFLFGILIPLVTLIDAYLLSSVRLSVSATIVSVIYWHVRNTRQELWGFYPLFFDEREEETVQVLQLE